MNPILKGTIAFGSVAGAGGLSYGVYNSMQTTPTVTPEEQTTTTYAVAFQGTLLSTTDENYKEKWEARLASLQAVKHDTELLVALRVLKTKDATEQWKTLRTWCQNTITNTTKGNQDQEFKNIQSYCTYSVKEKLGTNIILENDDTDASGKWKKAHDKLATTENLNSELTTAKSLTDGKGWEKVKTWCHSIYSNPYKGETDPDFAIAKQVCVSA